VREHPYRNASEANRACLCRARAEFVTTQDARNSNARTPTAHSHAESEITSLVSDLAGKAPLSHAHVDADIPAAIARDAEVAAAYSPIAHTHIVDVKEAEVDWGSPRTSARFTVVDATVSAGMQILAFQSGSAATNRQADENELESFTVRAVAGTGQFTAYCDALTGRLSGRYRIAYIAG